MLIWAQLCISIIKRDILILGKGPTQGLNDTASTVEPEHFMYFAEEEKKFYLSLH